MRWHWAGEEYAALAPYAGMGSDPSDREFKIRNACSVGQILIVENVL